jgi:hypothetical protein
MRIQRSVSDALDRAPAIAVVGTWDPLLEAHRDLFQKLARAGATQGLIPTVIILYPSPARLVNPDPDICLEYTDLKARVKLIRECAPVKVLVVRMITRDLGSPSSEFFDILKSHIRLRELWLGANQTLGRCKRNSKPALAALARKRNIVLRRLKVSRAKSKGGAAFRLLDDGKLKSAIARAGCAPIWGRPRSGVLRLNWPPGGYTALPIAQPSRHPVPTAAPIRFEIVAARRGARLQWPDEVEWLLFLAGPSDRNPAAKGRSTATTKDRKGSPRRVTVRGAGEASRL